MTRVDTILLVEDSDDDIFFMKRSLRAAGITSTLITLPNGQDAIDYLGRAIAGGPGVAAMPDLMFLDINMPQASGFDVLRWLRAALAAPPPVALMLSSSDATRDVDSAKELGAVAFCVKPLKPTTFETIASELNLVWKRTAD